MTNQTHSPKTPGGHSDDGKGTGPQGASFESDNEIIAEAIKDDETIGKQASLWSDAWRSLRKNPYFIVGAALSAFFTIMALFPGLFDRGIDPTFADLTKSKQEPNWSDGWFGYNVQGQDLYANVIHGARNSMLLALIIVIAVALIGTVIGALAGYYGGILDNVVSRIIEVFYAIPSILGAMLMLYTLFAEDRNVWTVALALITFGWMSSARLIRAGVLSVKESDFVAAARALGAPVGRIIIRHVLPNTLAPLIVISTIGFGQMIAAEAALSYLGIGLKLPDISWGIAIEQGRKYIRTDPHLVLIPGGVISLAVLSFILMGDALREALDPKNR